MPPFAVPNRLCGLGLAGRPPIRDEARPRAVFRGPQAKETPMRRAAVLWLTAVVSLAGLTSCGGCNRDEARKWSGVVRERNIKAD